MKKNITKIKPLIDISRDTVEEIRIPKDIAKSMSCFNYDKCLKIVIHGKPFSDSRPRLGRATVYSENKEKMKKVFSLIYEKFPLLNNNFIISPYHMYAKFYMPVTKNDERWIKRASSKIQRLFKQEKLGHVGEKDVDNMLKIHNDILFDYDYLITLSDGFNLGFIEPEKYLSEDPRTELYLIYSSKPNDYYKMKIENSPSYFHMMISYKYMKMQNRTPKQQIQYLTKYCKKELEKLKTVEQKRTLLKRFARHLEDLYPADVLKQIADLNDFGNKFNKRNAVHKIMLIITKCDPIAHGLIKRGGGMIYGK